jgi:hypothetical protein
MLALHCPRKACWPPWDRAKIAIMRSFAGLLIVAAIAGGYYYFAFNKMPGTDTGTTATQAISLVGVRGDLMQIAQAERNYVVTNGKCVPLSELISSNTLTLDLSGRDGYVYSVECSNLEYNAVARHNPAPPGSSTRYPNLAVDQNIQVHEIN